MKKNLFEMGVDFGDGWSSDNKEKAPKVQNADIKTPDKHQLHFAKEKRRGKVVTIVKPFYLAKEDLEELLKTLKKRVATGGTIKKDSLEFQGEISDLLRIHLETLGYRFKK